MILDLTSDHWKEIGEKVDDPILQGLLRSMISAFLHNSIPPGVTAAQIQAFKNAGLGLIKLEHQRTYLLEITEYVPTNPEKNRRFVFLRPTYYSGTCVGICPPEAFQTA
jgi:hypothetical protein